MSMHPLFADILKPYVPKDNAGAATQPLTLGVEQEPRSFPDHREHPAQDHPEWDRSPSGGLLRPGS